MSTSCQVSKGDLPMDISWFFNGKPFDLQDVSVSTNKRLSVLAIESVLARHAGEYTCVASNLAGTASRSVALTVNGKNLLGGRVSCFALSQGSCASRFRVMTDDNRHSNRIFFTTDYYIMISVLQLPHRSSPSRSVTTQQIQVKPCPRHANFQRAIFPWRFPGSSMASH